MLRRILLNIKISFPLHYSSPRLQKYRKIRSMLPAGLKWCDMNKQELMKLESSFANVPDFIQKAQKKS